MKFNWKKLKYWQKGGLIGLILGPLMLFLNFIFVDSDLLVGPIWFISGDLFCLIFNIGSAESCAFLFLYGGWIFMSILYGLIGALIGLIIQKVRK